MPTRKLYNITIPSDGQTQAALQGLGNEIESLSGLESDSPAVELLGINSGDQSIEASYANQRARVTAGELEELMAANGFDYLPYYTPDVAGRQGDGYIAIEDGSVEAASVHEDRVQVVSGTFTRSGSRGDKRRTLEVTPSRVSRNDYGNTTTALVAIPTSAGKRTWYQRETQAREPVVVAETVETEGGQMDLVDATSVSLTPPFELVHDPEYGDEARHDSILWDSRGYGARNGADGDLQWARCYRTGHEFDGVPVVDTGRLRLHLDTTGGLRVEEYDPNSDAWTAVDLPVSDWQLHDVDVTEISPTTIQAQCVYHNPTQTPSGEYALNLVARRGRSVVHWLTPPSISDPVPAGLRDYLTPIADPSVRRPNSQLSLIKRAEIRH